QPKAVANDTVQTTTNRRGELCSPVFICYELTGDRRSPLRVDIEFNLILSESIVVFVGFHGGSKPTPYAISNPCDNAHKTKQVFPYEKACFFSKFNAFI
ncbi:MAG: hypothetical protein PUG69_02100, partial [Ruminococcus sp.]|nr:hypothetical protein [Ruminococcus sp.]